MSKALEVIAAVFVPMIYGLLVSLFFDHLRRKRPSAQNGENGK